MGLGSNMGQRAKQSANANPVPNDDGKEGNERLRERRRHQKQLELQKERTAAGNLEERGATMVDNLGISPGIIPILLSVNSAATLDI